MARAGVFSTDDSQASLALGPGAITPASVDHSVLLQIAPRAPAAGASLPTGMVIAGNVYRFQVLDENGTDYQASGDPKPTLVLRSPAGVTAEAL